MFTPFTRNPGVLNDSFTVPRKTFPSAVFSPFASDTTKVVAIVGGALGWKTPLCVETQRHFPVMPGWITSGDSTSFPTATSATMGSAKRSSNADDGLST